MYIFIKEKKSPQRNFKNGLRNRKRRLKQRPQKLSLIQNKNGKRSSEAIVAYDFGFVRPKYRTAYIRRSKVVYIVPTLSKRQKQVRFQTLYHQGWIPLRVVMRLAFDSFYIRRGADSKTTICKGFYVIELFFIIRVLFPSIFLFYLLLIIF